MNNSFDELTRGMAQSVTRRAALKKFGVGLAGMALACFGLANKAEAGRRCSADADCGTNQVCCSGVCYSLPKWCDLTVDLCCCRNAKTGLPPCATNYWTCLAGCKNGGHK